MAFIGKGTEKPSWCIYSDIDCTLLLSEQSHQKNSFSDFARQCLYK